MRCTTCQIKATQVRRAITRLECAKELPVTGETVDRAVEHMVTIVDVLRRERALEDDALLDVWHLAGALELVEDHLAICREHSLPVVMWTQVRRVDEHVERFAIGWRGGRLATSRRGEIARRVRRRLAFLVDVFELLVRIAAEDKVVMREMIVALLQAEVEHH